MAESDDEVRATPEAGESAADAPPVADGNLSPAVDATSPTVQEPPSAPPQKEFGWGLLYNVLIAALLIAAGVQVYFLHRLHRGIRLPGLSASASPPSPSSTGLPSAPPGGPSGQSDMSPGGGLPPGGPPGSRGPVQAPPSVVFRALIVMQQNPSTALQPAQVAKLKPLLEQAAVAQHDFEDRITKSLGMQLTHLDPLQRTFLLSHAQEIIRSGQIPNEPPHWDALLALLVRRARPGSSAPAHPQGSAHAPALERNGKGFSDGTAAMIFTGMPPQALIGILLKMDTDPTLALRPDQARGLLEPVRAFRTNEKTFMRVMTGIIEQLDEPQKIVLMKLQQDRTLTSPDQPVPVEGVLRALGR